MLPPGTVSLTGDWARGDDSKQYRYYKVSYLKSCYHDDVASRLTTYDASGEKQHFANAKTKTQISFAATAKLISAFVSLHRYHAIGP